MTWNGARPRRPQGHCRAVGGVLGLDVDGRARELFVPAADGRTSPARYWRPWTEGHRACPRRCRRCRIIFRSSAGRWGIAARPGRPGPGHPARYAGSQAVLIVLDNREHLADGCAVAANAVVRRWLRVLSATSDDKPRSPS